jgi:hypothetical protein
VQAGNCGAADQLAMQHIAAADDAVGLQGRGSEVDGLSAGGFTGQGYVYDLRTGSTVASYQFGDPESALINDVTVTRHGAWFTDSLQAQLYFVPVSRAGVPGPSRTLALSGPAADTSGEFNLNGIQATTNGKTLIVAHSANAELYTVNPRTGSARPLRGSACPRSTASCWRVGGCGRCRTATR